MPPSLLTNVRKPSEIATVSKMQMREHSSAGRVKTEPESALHLPGRLDPWPGRSSPNTLFRQNVIPYSARSRIEGFVPERARKVR